MKNLYLVKFVTRSGESHATNVTTAANPKYSAITEVLTARYGAIKTIEELSFLGNL